MHNLLVVLQVVVSGVETVADVALVPEVGVLADVVSLDVVCSGELLVALRAIGRLQVHRQFRL